MFSVLLGPHATSEWGISEHYSWNLDEHIDIQGELSKSCQMMPPPLPHL